MLKIITTAAAFAVALAIPAYAETDPRGPWVGWAMSRSGHVFSSEPKDRIEDALIEAAVQCIAETKSDCRMYHVRPDTTVRVLHCNDSRGHEDVFVGFTTKETVFKYQGLWTARDEAREAGFREGQCATAYSNEPEDH